MDFEGFDPKKIDEYSQQAKVLYGKTDAYKEFEQKQKNRTKEQEKDLNAQVLDFFVRLAKCAPVHRIAKKLKIGQRSCRRSLRSIFTPAHPKSSKVWQKATPVVAA